MLAITLSQYSTVLRLTILLTCSPSLYQHQSLNVIDVLYSVLNAFVLVPLFFEYACQRCFNRNIITVISRQHLFLPYIKQNKYTPGTHLVIKSPSSLLLDCPKAVVIMAAAYSDEVAQTIEREYPQIEHVAILREEQLEVVKGG